MAETKIQWADYSFSPWIGCSRVSEGCRFCYAEEMMDHRFGKAKWGPQGTRPVTSDDNWNKPLLWNRKAREAGVRRRVFCAPAADVFEDRPELVEPRVRLFHLISETPHLDWLLLTKRPQNIRRFHGGDGVPRSWPENMPPNVWLGVSIENQDHVDRLDYLAEIPATVHFVSAEPLLGPLVLSGDCSGKVYNWLGSHSRAAQWVIVGGESGRNARPCGLAWIASLIEQCRDAAVACFVKQLGRRPYIDHSPEPAASIARKHGVGPLVAQFIRLRDRAGGDMAEWPDELCVREVPGEARTLVRKEQ